MNQNLIQHADVWMLSENIYSSSKQGNIPANRATLTP